ncbi:hypothetical protein Ancab_010774 [Ancistrocladus abbreviatus]
MPINTPLSMPLKWLFPLLLLLLPNVGISKFVVETLPGYPGNLPFKLETGYIGVGELDEVQLFYYFIESERDPTGDPLVFWLAGGPGCSGFSALAYEIGPLSFNYSDFKGGMPTFELNKYSWTKVASIIFIDSPVGTGYSYSTTSEGYRTGDTLSARHAYTFLRKWLMDHPEFSANPLYIGGDSYSGIVVPIVVQQILDGNELNFGSSVNINGYILGNPYTSYKNEINSRLPYAHRMNLISDDLHESAESSCNGDFVNVDSNNTACMKEIQAIKDCTRDLYMPHILEPTCSWESQKLDITKWDQNAFQENINFLHLSRSSPQLWCRAMNYYLSSLWMNSRVCQDGLGVREGTVKNWIRCRKDLSYTTDVNSTFDYHKSLTSKFLRALIYSGDQDLLVPYVGTRQWIKALSLPVTDNWRPWFQDGQVAGYTSKYSNVHYRLTFATAKGAGHTAPEYKPKECFSMINRWLAYYPL